MLKSVPKIKFIGRTGANQRPKINVIIQANDIGVIMVKTVFKPVMLPVATQNIQSIFDQIIELGISAKTVMDRFVAQNTQNSHANPHNRIKPNRNPQMWPQDKQNKPRNYQN